MSYTYLLLLALTLSVTTLSQSYYYSFTCDENFGKRWQPSWIANPRDDLRCQLNDYCRNESTQVKYKQFDKCCVCYSCAIWEGSEVQLFIEYVSVLGKSLVFPDQASNDTEVYEIEHINGEMSAIPSNLCNWDNDTGLISMYSNEFQSVEHVWNRIVRLNFENNKISNLTNLSCLSILDELNLNNNILTYISNTSFTNLTHLRKVYFSGNLIKKIDPGILTAKNLNVFAADFSHNKMSELDVSNMISLYPFCNIDFRTNKITKLVNEANFTLEITKTYGPGFVSFKDNKLETFPDFKELLHLDDIAQMGKLISSGFDYRDIPLICDCHLEPFMTLTQEVISTLWHDYMTVKCDAPPDLKGMNITEVDTGRLICKLPANSNCQTPTCTCFDKPKNNTLYVNCSRNGNAILKTLPTIPKSNLSQFIAVDISGHKISDIGNITQLSCISMLNASGNDILEISNDVATALENATVDISNNLNLRHLPRTFQYHNVCNIYMSNLIIDCDCNSTWIETWLKSQKCINMEQMFNCRLPNGKIKSALMFRATDIECFFYKYPIDIIVGLTVSIIIIIATSTLVYTFRYDIVIIFVRMKQRDRSQVLYKYSHDVFLSYNDADENVTKWIENILEDNLVAAGYRVFQAGHDVTFGAERNSEVLDAINKTSNFLLILSDSYLEQDHNEMRPWTENEWKYGWHNFLRDKYKNLIIINFDHMSSFEVNHPQIKAFLRVGCTIDFKNQDGKIMKYICKKLGKPFQLQIKGLENMKNKPLDISILPYIADEKSETPMKTFEHTNKTNSLRYMLEPDKYKSKTSARQRNKGQMTDGISGHLKGPFQCYLEDLSLKKTPNIPFNKKSKTNSDSRQPKLRNPLTTNKLKKLSDIYNRHPSNICMPENLKCKDRGATASVSVQDVTRCKSNMKHRGEVRNHTLDDFEDKDDIFQLNMSNSETTSLGNSCAGFDNTDIKSLIGSLNTNLNGFGESLYTDTNSLRESSNTYTRSLRGSSNTVTTSISGSTVSFKSETLSDNNLTEISNA